MKISCLFKSKKGFFWSQKLLNFVSQSDKGEGGQRERRVLKFPSGDIHFAAISGEMLVHKSVLLRYVMTLPSLPEIYSCNHSVVSIMLYWTERIWAHVIAFISHVIICL